eukprot:687687-Ditylum_brightwellii.AAC.1
MCQSQRQEVYGALAYSRFYKVGTPEECLQFMDAIAQIIKGQDITDLDVANMLVTSLLCGDALQVFRNEEAVEKERDSPAFTKFSAVVSECIFPTKAYKLEFNKEGFGSRSSTLEEFLDTCVYLEEAEIHKPIAKKTAIAQKDHDKVTKPKGKAGHQENTQSQIHAMKNITWDITPESKRKKYASTMVFVTMTLKNATMCVPAGSTHSSLTAL